RRRGRAGHRARPPPAPGCGDLRQRAGPRPRHGRRPALGRRGRRRAEHRRRHRDRHRYRHRIARRVEMNVQKGAIVGLDPSNPLASLIVFQYNPETLTRSVQVASAAEGTESQTNILRFFSPPSETISVDIEIDATDQLERGDATTQTLGIHPALASLEM